MGMLDKFKIRLESSRMQKSLASLAQSMRSAEEQDFLEVGIWRGQKLVASLASESLGPGLSQQTLMLNRVGDMGLAPMAQLITHRVSEGALDWAAPSQLRLHGALASEPSEGAGIRELISASIESRANQAAPGRALGS